MPKVYIRTLWPDDGRGLWSNRDQREGLRHYLNDQGFYVLTGAGDSLEVYGIDYSEPLDVRAAKKALETLAHVWQAWKTKKEASK